MNKVQWERAIQKARPYEPNREQFVNLRRRAMGFLVGYSLSAMTVFGLIGFCIVREIVDWAKGFKQPAINANAIQLLFEDRPAIIWLLAASVVVGLVVALAGTAVLFAIMGDERRPNRKVLLLAAGLPLMLWLMGLAMTVTTSPYGALLAAPIMLLKPSMMGAALR